MTDRDERDITIYPHETPVINITGAGGPPGIPGPAGPQGPPGHGWNFRGQWQQGIAYQPGDAVTFDGTIYVAVLDTTGSPQTDPAGWLELTVPPLSAQPALPVEPAGMAGGTGMVSDGGHTHAGVTRLAGTVPTIASLPWFNVKDFGAVGDFTADDTAAIQAALDAVPDIGGLVFFLPGLYKISARLRPKHNTYIDGGHYAAVVGGIGNYQVGSVIAWDPTVPAPPTAMVDCTDRVAVHLRGITLNGLDTANLTGLLWDSTNNPSNEWCSIEDFMICRMGTNGGTDGYGIEIGRSGGAGDYQCDKGRIISGLIVHCGTGIQVDSANGFDQGLAQTVGIVSYGIGINMPAGGGGTYANIIWGGNRFGTDPADIQIRNANTLTFINCQAEKLAAGQTWLRVAGGSPDGANQLTLIGCDVGGWGSGNSGLILDIAQTKRVIGIGNRWVAGNVRLAASAIYRSEDTFVPFGTTFRTVTDATITAGSATLTSPTAGFAAGDVGLRVSGHGIPGTATIASVTSPTTVELSAAATQTVAGTGTVTFDHGVLYGSATAEHVDLLAGFNSADPLLRVSGQRAAALLALRAVGASTGVTLQMDGRPVGGSMWNLQAVGANWRMFNATTSTIPLTVLGTAQPNALVLAGTAAGGGAIRINNAASVYSGTGEPAFAATAGDLYFRTGTPGAAGQRIYVCTGGAVWSGIA